MAATITGSGTWSTIASAERPVTHEHTVEERYGYETLVYEDDLAGNKGGFPELEQFLALMGAAYSIPGIGAAVRLQGMLKIYLNRTRTAGDRSYTP